MVTPNEDFAVATNIWTETLQEIAKEQSSQDARMTLEACAGEIDQLERRFQEVRQALVVLVAANSYRDSVGSREDVNRAIATLERATENAQKVLERTQA